MTLAETRVIENTEDTLDVPDIIARVEFLEGGEEIDQDAGSEDQEELTQLRDLLTELKGNGGDKEWQGDWYPGTLIRDSYFREYAQELAEDIGAISGNAQWPLNCIDWDAATEQLQQDYSSVDVDGVTYWYR